MNNGPTYLIPQPYGSIMKYKSSQERKANKHTKEDSLMNLDSKCNDTKTTSTLYPFFISLSPASVSFFSFFNNLFSPQHHKDTHIGFMPRTTPNTANTQTSPLDITVPVSNPIDCYYESHCYEQDAVSSLSTSSSSSDSENSLDSLILTPPSYCMEEDVRNYVRNSITRNSISTAALSNILCDHYVHTQTNSPPSTADIVDIPLETFRIFEASNILPPTEACWTIGEQSNDEPREWVLIEILSKHSKKANEKLFGNEKEKETAVNLAADTDSQQCKEENESALSAPVSQFLTSQQSYHARDVRANAAYLRMIVAEVNMMRSQKIIGPLRPRRVLPKRLDRFIRRPSPLQLITV